MKRISGIKLLLLLPAFLACSSDDGGVVQTPPPPDNEGEGTVGIAPAFPQLSFEAPLDLQSPDDGSNRLFVVEQGGRIRVFSNNPETAEAGTFLDISNRTNTSAGELGLLGLAFHPDYDNNGYFYVYYTPTAQESVLSRFSVSAADPDVADPGSETVLLSIEQPFTNHNGGQLTFGPDGYLYVASGDGGSGGDPQGNGQDLSSLLGKILRLDVDRAADGNQYAIPASNPFIDEAGARPEIYAYGLRNPWRISFDPQTGELWAGDVGEGAWEEIDLIVAGGNYGWNVLEGTHCFEAQNCDDEGLIGPVLEYGHEMGDKSVTGGFVYRGSQVPGLQGQYVFGDFISGRIWAFPADAANPARTLLAESGLGISSFGTDNQGELYLCAFDGSVYRFVQE